MARDTAEAGSETKLDLERLADAAARRVRKAWKLTDDLRATRANYHPIAQVADFRTR